MRVFRQRYGSARADRDSQDRRRAESERSSPRCRLTSSPVSRAPCIGRNIVPSIQLNTVLLAQIAIASIAVAVIVKPGSCAVAVTRNGHPGLAVHARLDPTSRASHLARRVRFQIPAPPRVAPSLLSRPAPLDLQSPSADAHRSLPAIRACAAENRSWRTTS